jgi:hypothetical protein
LPQEVLLIFALLLEVSPGVVCVDIVADLKKKWTSVSDEIAELRDTLTVLERQKTAFETVIRTYEPDFVAGMIKTRRKQKSKDGSPIAIVTELLRNKNNRHVVLHILRRCDRPMTSVDIADEFSFDEGLSEDRGRQTALASRFSGTLHNLMNQGLVKRTEFDGKRFLWEIAR